MHNIVILGSGRSGTSMVAGTLRNAGYFRGGDLHTAREGNPKGVFESGEVNAINEQILASVSPRRPRFIGKWLFRNRPRRYQMWLARIPLDTKISCSPELGERMSNLVRREPFCFKDPRFSYTLPCWLPYLTDTRYVVVFRDPAATAASIEKECRDWPYLHDLSLTRPEIIDVWTLMYSHILRSSESPAGPWLFLHYNQVLKGDGLDRLEDFSRAPVDRSFPEASLRHSLSDEPVSGLVQEIYCRLCDLAYYNSGDRGKPCSRVPPKRSSISFNVN